ncbi:hypothetical protein BCR34DRAFT_582166 [Clohesyomyces aquaticus]|uniref:Uncharacterized protein n=1 Tax=Clohesyomyces aquaticus TaxID=1231657 RepID=A0A1Y2AA61_9PLEO|nr:hypothetical protein BCR34DRAFT_582166 [Clohesyomyces aquaticus]
MSDSNSQGATPTASSQFTERELQILSWAMQSLKSGPPEVDYEKLAVFAGMSNPRSASNAWAKIRTKLMTPSDGTAAPKPTPKKKKAAAKAKDDGSDEANGDEPTTPKKTPRKRTAKKQEAGNEADSPSPKKCRPTKGRKASEEAEAAPVKKEDVVEDEDVAMNSDEAADQKDATDGAKKEDDNNN